MRLSFVPLLAFLAAGAAFGQDARGVVLINALNEQASCITAPDNILSNTHCGNSGSLPLQRTVPLLVLNRHYLTSYTLEFSESEKVAQPRLLGGAVHAVPFLAEGQVPTQPAPGIERKTALDFLSQLLDVTSSSEADAEIERERNYLAITSTRIKMDIRAFNQKYLLIVGAPPLSLTGGPSGNTSKLECDPTAGRHSGHWLQACLQAEFDFAGAQFSGNLGNEQKFRALVKMADGLFGDVKNLGAELAATDLVSQGRAIETEIAGYEKDHGSFQSNLDAARDAALVVEQLNEVDPPLLSLQIRSLLRRRMAAEAAIPGSSKPTLDEAEANEQIDRYLELLKNANSIQRSWADTLTQKVADLRKEKEVFTFLDLQQSLVDDKIHGELPVLIARINEGQEHLAARIDDIYESNTIDVTESQFGLDSIAANGVVSYRILRTNEFEPYVVTQDKSIYIPPSSVEVSRGAFAVIDISPSRSRRTVWQILRLTH